MKVQILSYDTVASLEQKKKIDKIIKYVERGDLVLIEGKLKAEDEIELINRTMELVNKKLKTIGVDIAYLDTLSSKNVADKLKNYLVKILVKERFGISVIGPSNIVKEIKKDPNHIEVLMK